MTQAPPPAVTAAYARETERAAPDLAHIPHGTLARHQAPRAATVIEGIGVDGQTFVSRVPLK